MKPSLTMFNNNDTFENFFLFGCYKTSFVNHTKKLFFWNHNQVVFTTSMTSSPSSSSINTLVTHHNNVGNYFNFICMKHSLTMLTLPTTSSSSTKNFSFMIINNNFQKLFHSWSSTTTSKNFFIHDHQQQLHHHQQKTFSSIIIIPAKYKPSHWPAPPHGQHNHHRSVYPYNVDPNSTSYRYTSSCSP